MRDGVTSNDDVVLTYTETNEPQTVSYLTVRLHMATYDTHANNDLTSVPSMLFTVYDMLEVDWFHVMLPRSA